MIYDYDLFLTKQFELIESNNQINDEKLLALVKTNVNEYLANYTYSYNFRNINNNQYLNIANWQIAKIVIHRSWNQSGITQLLASKNGLYFIDLTSAIRKTKLNVWGIWNNGIPGNRLNSRIIKECIKFLECLPLNLYTQTAIEIYTSIFEADAEETKNLYNQFKTVVTSLEKSEIIILEDLFQAKTCNLNITNPLYLD